MLTQQVLNCSFSRWYQLFSHLTIESEIISLPNEFTKYLLSDGIILPKSCEIAVSFGSNDWSSDEDSEEESKDANNSIDFPQLNQKMNETLLRLNSVFPKLNWSSCQDSQWMTTSGTKCGTTCDIFLLLKSSDCIVHDLTQPFKFCEDFNENQFPSVDYELVLKKWIDMNPSMEYRCFIANDIIIGISQRDVRSYYYHINQQKVTIVSDIKRFFDNNMKSKFFDKEFVIDIYRPNDGQVILIDINPFGQSTDSLLFDWDELNQMRDNYSNDEPQFRCLTGETGIQSQTHSQNSLPIDVNYGHSLTDLTVSEEHIER